MPIPRIASTQPSAQTFEGVPGGMNLALPGQEIQDTEARYLQDILLDYPGLTRRRGPVQGATGFPTFTTYLLSGITQTIDPLGNLRIAVARGDNSSSFIALLNAAYNGSVDFPWSGALPTGPPSNPYRIFDSKAALTGGTWIGTSSSYNASSPVQNLALWRGGIKLDYSTGTVSVTRGTTTLTGSGTSWLANASPGMFVLANTDDPYTLAYVGVVKTVVSDTSITLGDVSPYTSTAKTYKLTSLRGFAPRVVKGRITTTTASTTVTGANSKFVSQGVAGGSIWNLYRASDLGFVGKVSTVNNDTSITLTANAALALNNERYIALNSSADINISTATSSQKVGFLNATYAERQWYANNGQSFPLTSRVHFSDTSDPEAVDMSTFDGDFINIASSAGVNLPIKGMMASYNALLIFKENETFGVFGSTPTTFSVKKIEDDGALNAGSIQSYGGGVLWAGRNGIYFYNGIESKNITVDNLGDYYKNALHAINPDTYRMWSMVARDHYFLFIEQANPSKPVLKGAVSTTPNRLCFAVNMVSRAVTTFTNFNIRGSVRLPASSGYESLYIVNSATTGYICSSIDFFDTEGNDAITCAGDVAGPDFYFESKKYSMGDSMHKKLFKQLSMNYLAQGDALKLDTVVGLNEIGRTSTSTFPATVYTWDTLATAFGTWDNLAANVPTWDQVILSVFAPKRIKFLKRTQNLSFRLYQNSSAVTRARLGPFNLEFKWQRIGRI